MAAVEKRALMSTSHSRRLENLRRKQRLERLTRVTSPRENHLSYRHVLSDPIPPPLPPTILTALDPATPVDVLETYAVNYPCLRHWIAINASSPPELVEKIAQMGGNEVVTFIGFLLQTIEGKPGKHL